MDERRDWKLADVGVDVSLLCLCYAYPLFISGGVLWIRHRRLDLDRLASYNHGKASVDVGVLDVLNSFQKPSHISGAEEGII
jgi:hypothetical protein